MENPEIAHSNANAVEAGPLGPGALATPDIAARTMDHVRRALGARAAGLWRLEGIALAAVAQSFSSELPAPLAAAFRAELAHVRLSRRDLAIVEAVIRKGIVAAAAAGAFESSAHWLARLGAERSFAIPVFGARRVLGVLALAFPEGVTDTIELRDRLEQLGEELALSMAMRE